MSDAIDAVAEALARNKKLAASHLVRKEELDAEIARLRGQRGLVEDAALAQEVDARLAAAGAEVDQAEQGYRSALAEIEALKKLAGGARAAAARAVVASAVSPDPVLRSDEDTALDNARAHIADLGAQAR